LKVVTTFQLALLSLLGKIIKVASCSGAVAEKVRQAGRKSPCQWQSRSDLCMRTEKGCAVCLSQHVSGMDTDAKMRLTL